MAYFSLNRNSHSSAIFYSFYNDSFLFSTFSAIPAYVHSHSSSSTLQEAHAAHLSSHTLGAPGEWAEPAGAEHADR